MASELRKRFLKDVKNVVAPEVLVTAVELPTGAIETAVNTTKLKEKIAYIESAYNDDFFLKNNLRVKLVGYMLV